MNKENNIETAIAWWNGISPYGRGQLTEKYFSGRVVTSLTGREVQTIWAYENPAPPSAALPVRGEEADNVTHIELTDERILISEIHKFLTTLNAPNPEGDISERDCIFWRINKLLSTPAVAAESKEQQIEHDNTGLSEQQRREAYEQGNISESKEVNPVELLQWVKEQGYESINIHPRIGGTITVWSSKWGNGEKTSEQLITEFINTLNK